MGEIYNVHEETLTAIADATRNLVKENGKYTPDAIARKISENHLGLGLDVRFYEGDDEWARPEEWPDLDRIIIPEDFDGVYLTYDLSKTPGLGWIGVRTYSPVRSTMSVDRGHVENGVFVVDEHHEHTYASHQSNGPVFRKDLDEADGQIQLWRVTSDAPIYRFYFMSKTASNSASMAAKFQPCVEATGQLLNVTGLVSDSLDYRQNYYSYSTIWLEKDSRAVKSKNLATLYMAWYQSYNLRVLDFSKWDISQANVSSLANAFRECYSLRNLDLSNWDTSNWFVTNLSNMCDGCRSLQTFKATTWDTSNWKVTTLASAWQLCFSLKVLDLSNWDTSGWVVTAMNSTWYECRSLISLKVSNWDTSNWAVTSLASTFRACRSLRRMEAESWDTLNWKITTMSYAFADCHLLESLDLSKWDTSNWAVTSLSNAFAALMSIKELDLSSFDTSNWAVTTIESMFSTCFCMTKLDVSGWDTSGWRVTTIRSAFGYCYSLKELDLSDWDTSGWSLATNAMGYTFVDLYALRALKGLETWTCLESVTQSGNIPSNRFFKECTGLPVVYSHSYDACIALSKESLVNILTALPEVSNKTITLGTTNICKLTPEEIAIATQKGWTVA